MSRRGENIRKRKDGRWEGRYTCIQENTGGTRVCSVYARSYSEVRQKLAEAKQKAREDARRNSVKKQSDGAGILFSDAAAEWLVSVRKNKKYSTYVKYNQVYEKYLKDFMKGHTLDDVDTEFMEEAVLPYAAELSEGQAVSDSLEKSIYCIVCRILGFASLKYHVRVNIVKRPAQCIPKKPVQIFNLSEQKELVDFLNRDTDLYKLGIILSLYTGLRLGELCALKWADIDMENRIIRVTSTVQRLPMENPVSSGRRTALLETAPKSFCSKREIPVNDKLFQLLSEFRHDGKYVICRNKAADPRTYQKKFAAYLKAAGVEYRSFHTLRHTFASNCASYGADAKVISEILGHANVQITLNRYVHPSMNLKRKYVNLLPIHLAGQKMGQAG